MSCTLKKIDDEQDCLVKLVIYETIPTSQWASFIVPVFKSDGLIRICGNYKQTASWEASRDKYPVPKTEDIVTTKNGGICKVNFIKRVSTVSNKTWIKKFTGCKYS